MKYSCFVLRAAALLTATATHAQQPQPTPAEAQKAADEAYHQRQEYLLHNDWPNLQQYAAANQRLPAPQSGRPRVVIIGNSITEGWVKEDSAFFRVKPTTTWAGASAGRARGSLCCASGPMSLTCTRR